MRRFLVRLGGLLTPCHLGSSVHARGTTTMMVPSSVSAAPSQPPLALGASPAIDQLKGLLSVASQEAIVSSLVTLKRAFRVPEADINGAAIGAFAHLLMILPADGSWISVETASLVVDCIASSTKRRSNYLTDQQGGIAVQAFLSSQLEQELATSTPEAGLEVLKRRATLLHTAHTMYTMGDMQHQGSGFVSSAAFRGLWWLVVEQLAGSHHHQGADRQREELVLPLADMAFACGVLTKIASAHAQELAAYRRSMLLQSATGSEAGIDEASRDALLLEKIGGSMLRAIKVAAPPADGRGGDASSSGMASSSSANAAADDGCSNHSFVHSHFGLLSMLSFLSSPYVLSALGVKESGSPAGASVPRDFAAAALVIERVVAGARVLKTAQLANLFASLARIADMGAPPRHKLLFKHLTQEGPTAVLTPRTISLLVDRMNQVTRYLLKRDVLTFLPSFATLMVNISNRAESQQVAAHRPVSSPTPCSPITPPAPSATSSRFTKRKGITAEQNSSNAASSTGSRTSSTAPGPDATTSSSATRKRPAVFASQQDIADLEEETDVLLDDIATTYINRVDTFDREHQRRYDKIVHKFAGKEASWSPACSFSPMTPSELARFVQGLDTFAACPFDLIARLVGCLEYHLDLFEGNTSVVYALSAVSRSPFSSDCAVLRRLFGRKADRGIRDWFSCRIFPGEVRVGELILAQLDLSDFRQGAIVSFSPEQVADIFLSYCRIMSVDDADRARAISFSFIPFRCLRALDVAIDWPTALESNPADPSAKTLSTSAEENKNLVRLSMTGIAALATFFSRIGNRFTSSYILSVPAESLARFLRLLEKALRDLSSSTSAEEADDDDDDDDLAAKDRSPTSMVSLHKMVAPHLLLEAFVNLCDIRHALLVTSSSSPSSTGRVLADHGVQEVLLPVLDRIQNALDDALRCRDEFFLRRMFGSIYSDEYFSKVLRYVTPVGAATIRQRLEQSNRFLSSVLVPFTEVHACSKKEDTETKKATTKFSAAIIARCVGNIESQCRCLSSLVSILRCWHTADRVDLPAGGGGGDSLIRAAPLRRVVLRKVRLFLRPSDAGVSSSAVMELLEMFGHDEELLTEISSLFTLVQQQQQQLRPSNTGEDGGDGKQKGELTADFKREVPLAQIDRMLKALTVTSREVITSVLTAILPQVKQAARQQWNSAASAVTVLEFYSKYLPREARGLPLMRCGELPRGAVDGLSLPDYCRVFTFLHESHQPAYMEDWRRAFVREMKSQHSSWWFPVEQVVQLYDAPVTSTASSFRPALVHTLRIKLVHFLSPKATATSGEDPKKKTCIFDDDDGEIAAADASKMFSLLELRHWKAMLGRRSRHLIRITGVELERRTGDATRPTLIIPAATAPNDAPIGSQLISKLAPSHLLLIAQRIGNSDFLQLCAHTLEQAEDDGGFIYAEHWRDAAAEAGSAILSEATAFLCSDDTRKPKEGVLPPSIDLRHWLPAASLSSMYDVGTAGAAPPGVVLSSTRDEPSRIKILQQLIALTRLMLQKPSSVTTAKSTTTTTNVSSAAASRAGGGGSSGSVLLHLTGVGQAAQWARDYIVTARAAGGGQQRPAVEPLRRFFSDDELWSFWEVQQKKSSGSLDLENELAWAFTSLFAIMFSNSGGLPFEDQGLESPLHRVPDVQQRVGQLTFTETHQLYALMDSASREMDGMEGRVSAHCLTGARKALCLRMEELLAGAGSEEMFLVVQSVLSLAGERLCGHSSSTAADEHDWRRFMGKVALVLTHDVERFIHDCGMERVTELAQLLHRLGSLSDAQVGILSRLGLRFVPLLASA